MAQPTVKRPLELDSPEKPVRPPSSASRLACTLLYCSIVFVQGCCVNILGPAGMTISQKMGANLESMGSVMSAEGAGAICGAAFIVILFNKFSGHGIIIRVGLLLVCALLAIELCSSISHMVMVYCVIGGCLGCMSGVACTLVSWVQAGRNVGPWVNLVNSAFGVSSSAAPLFFVFVERVTGDGMHCYRSFAALALANVCLAWLLPSPRAPFGTGGGDALQRMVGQAHGRSTLCGIDLGSRSNYVRVTVVLPLMAAMALGIGGEIAYGAWVYSYATGRVGMPKADAAWVNALYWVTFTIAPSTASFDTNDPIDQLSKPASIWPV